MIYSDHLLIRVQPALSIAAKEAARKAGISKSELIRRALEREIGTSLAGALASTSRPQT